MRIVGRIVRVRSTEQFVGIIIKCSWALSTSSVIVKKE
jgi:hypothetical protein